MDTYHTGSFCGGNNIYLNLITCENKIFITSIIQIYVLHLYHLHLLHPVKYRTEAIILQHFYWPVIRNAVRKELTNCDTYKRTKRPNKNYGKLSAKEDEEIPRNKLCVYIIGPYVIIRKEHK